MPTVTFKISDEGLAKLDAAAQRAGVTRSEFIKRAVMVDSVTVEIPLHGPTHHPGRGMVTGRGKPATSPPPSAHPLPSIPPGARSSKKDGYLAGQSKKGKS